MTSALLSLFTSHPPGSTQTSPSTVLSLARRAPSFLSNASSSHSDTPETWLLYENLLLTCLRSHDDLSARICLDRLTARFGEKNEQVMALRGLYDEAMAKNRAELEAIVKRYEDVLVEDPTNTPIHKRLISLLTSLAYVPRAISNLTSLVGNNPNDAESWAELSALYFSQGLYPQSVFCLEEVILIYPNAYNIFARLGEVTYTLAISTSAPDVAKLLEAQRYFLRSIELCENYLRGYYGLVVVTGKLLASGTKLSSGEGNQMSREKVEKLRVMAVQQLGDIVGRARRKESGWTGYNEAEIEASGKLIDEIQQRETK